jgi:hypothetical protein
MTLGTSVVILGGEPPTPEVRGSALLQALQDGAPELAQGAIVSPDWSGPSRARVLPLISPNKRPGAARKYLRSTLVAGGQTFIYFDAAGPPSKIPNGFQCLSAGR